MLSKVVLHLTKQCNLRCNHCYWACGNQYPHELTTQEIYSLLYQFKINYPKLDICLEGGEFFLRKDWFDVLEYANILGFKPRITTNSILLNNAIISEIKNMVTSLNFSLDGTTDLLHDTIRGSAGLFQKVISCIEFSTQQGIDTRISSIVMKKNINNLVKMPLLAGSLNVQRLGYYSFIPLGRGNEYSKELMILPSERFNFIKEVLKVSSGVSCKVKLLIFNALYPSSTVLMSGQKISCSASEKIRCDIGPTGEVYPCGLLIGTPLSIGNIRNNNFNDIWLYANEWSFWHTYHNLKGEECRGCNYFSYCKGGCPSMTVLLNASIESRDPFCTKEYIPICRFRDYDFTHDYQGYIKS